ncbi:hypothetical protein BFW38_06575 [Terasakiispira papahanaumokuakeensis]|uniref:DUF1232 domain-containing protein n=1 Tax=Terasakiispira papahanaumokuakeensis TaxID=197479 RepID=A0A1E2VEF4_9GAMM|nr:hypothetical protein BFW38_06575 [Terasakiispira papahanaumokuakeensis]
MPPTQSLARHARDRRSKNRFWQKVKRHGVRAGRALLLNALTLYCAALDKETSRRARWTIYLALGYFIWPIDLLPDFLPGLGYTDDMGVLAWAMTQVALHIKPEHRNKAKQWIERWRRNRRDQGAGDD